ncbi:MAG: DNA-directed RNA polymerase [Methanomassiliicoccales archaeon]|nr:MAG: DNA-directed RNA polymerase [Methanomassiliicoccales archaeon]
MYQIITREEVVRIPPEQLTENINEVVERLTQQNFEGKIGKTGGLTVLTTNIERLGEGRIVHGDGAVYQGVRYDALIFVPDLQEIVHGTVCEMLKFGAFVRFGPLDGLLHISQVMDDRIDVDVANSRLTGKDTRRDLKVGDDARARIVAVSINERSPRESKIGLTMRQPALGKFEWIEEDIRGEGPKKPTKKKKAKKRGKKKGKER